MPEEIQWRVTSQSEAAMISAWLRSGYENEFQRIRQEKRDAIQRL